MSWGQGCKYLLFNFPFLRPDLVLGTEQPAAQSCIRHARFVFNNHIAEYCLSFTPAVSIALLLWASRFEPGSDLPLQLHGLFRGAR